MSNTPVANKRPFAVPFSDSNAILTIVSGAHAVNHAFSTLMPLIYPLLQTFLADSAPNLDRALAFGLYFTIAFGVGAFWVSVLGWEIDNFGFATGFHIMTLSYIAAGLALLPTREME